MHVNVWWSVQSFFDLNTIAADFKRFQDDMPRQLEYKDDDTGWDREFAGAPKESSCRMTIIHLQGPGSKCTCSIL